MQDTGTVRHGASPLYPANLGLAFLQPQLNCSTNFRLGRRTVGTEPSFKKVPTVNRGEGGFHVMRGSQDSGVPANQSRKLLESAQARRRDKSLSVELLTALSHIPRPATSNRGIQRSAFHGPKKRTRLW
jgi:hypothetical protein